jgi:glutathione S-transferase
VRLLVWHQITRDQEALDRIAARFAPGPLRRVRPLAGRALSTFVSLRYRVKSEDSAAAAREHIIAAFDRLEQELGDGDYLVGDAFTVADLTAAAILYPIVTPPEGPELPDPPATLEEFRAPLKERRGYRWVADMYRRHRNAGASRGQAAASAPAP